MTDSRQSLDESVAASMRAQAQKSERSKYTVSREETIGDIGSACMSSKQAEKDYLQRTGAGDWELAKPFSPPGNDTLEDSLELLHDFGVAIRLLKPTMRDRIADLGAGAGWCSDLLMRMNRRSVAIDIATSMLRVARQRPTRTPMQAVACDLETLAFQDGTFDKAVCLNALHHVPNMAAAVHEIARILTPQGMAVFSEPGQGHAAVPASIAATHDFGVLEQEVLIDPFLEECQRAGFVDVRVCPIAYVIPEFQLSADEWKQWRALPRRTRPLRALDKMGRAALEFAGIGKGSILFEEAFAMRLARLFQQPVEEHPYILASKTALDIAAGRKYDARISLEALPDRVTAGEHVVALVKIANRGTERWRATANAGEAGQVRVGMQLLDEQGRLIAKDFARGDLTADVAPGGTAVVRVTFSAPAAGRYEMKVDLVAEGVTWFEPTGSAVARRTFVVS
jgi:2-polyprenyl-3-methyl-5-hydroxy-6-metoxy-1,4-benzoquinol methylase